MAGEWLHYISVTNTITAYFIHLMLGFCSDGEFNSLRNQGYTRPLSVLRIMSDVRSKYSRGKKNRMTSMLTPTRMSTGLVCCVLQILVTICDRI